MPLAHKQRLMELDNPLVRLEANPCRTLAKKVGKV
jgi:hypothetical protein